MEQVKVGQLWKNKKYDEYMLITNVKIKDPAFVDWIHYDVVGEDNSIKHGVSYTFFMANIEYVSG